MQMPWQKNWTLIGIKYAHDYKTRANPGLLFTKRTDVSNPHDSGLNISSRSEIGQAPRQHRFRDTCQIYERYYHYHM